MDLGVRVSRVSKKAGTSGNRVTGGGWRDAKRTTCLFHVLVRSNFSSLHKNILIDIMTAEY